MMTLAPSEVPESAGLSKLWGVVRSLLCNSLLDLSSDSGLSLGVGESVLSEPLLVLGVLLNELTGSLLDLLSDGCLLVDLDSVGVLSDLSVNLLVESLGVGDLCLGEACLPLGELLLEEILVQEDETVEVGAVLARIGDGSGKSAAPAEPLAAPAETPAPAPEPAPAPAPAATAAPATSSTRRSVAGARSASGCSAWFAATGGSMSASSSRLPSAPAWTTEASGPAVSVRSTVCKRGKRGKKLDIVRLLAILAAVHL